MSMPHISSVAYSCALRKCGINVPIWASWGFCTISVVCIATHSDLRQPDERHISSEKQKYVTHPSHAPIGYSILSLFPVSAPVLSEPFFTSSFFLESLLSIKACSRFTISSNSAWNKRVTHHKQTFRDRMVMNSRIFLFVCVYFYTSFMRIRGAPISGLILNSCTRKSMDTP